MTRALQNSLALANVKIKHGWENLSIDAIEPRIAEEYHRKRPSSSSHASSSSASSVAGDMSSSRGLASSPLTVPMFSDDDMYRSAKRRRTPASSQTGRKTAIQSWKKSYNLPQSSPVATRPAARVSLTAVPEPASPTLSEEDDTDLPISSFTLQPSMITESPPRTPKATGMLHRNTKVSWSRTPRNDEGADLLMYLATSPTPATLSKSCTSAVPSTPPSMHSALPSSILHTPGYTGLFNVPNTPSNNVNFADFCNVTPSPARSAWPKTPATAILRTPLAVSSAKRMLNFEQLVPPVPSPTPGRHTRSKDAIRT